MGVDVDMLASLVIGDPSPPDTWASARIVVPQPWSTLRTRIPDRLAFPTQLPGFPQATAIGAQLGRTET
jgi:hypothetical protein